MFAPVAGQPAEMVKPSKNFSGPAQITAYRSVISDDGAFAIVLFETHDRAAFEPILSDHNVVKSFDPAITPLETLLPALQTFQKRF